jgi:hypothetical protein
MEIELAGGFDRTGSKKSFAIVQLAFSYRYRTCLDRCQAKRETLRFTSR